MLGGQSSFTSSPVPVHRVPEVPAARFFQVKCITSTDEFLHWNEGPDRLRGAWKAKFYVVKPWSESNRRSSVVLEPDRRLQQKLEISRRATEKVPLLSKGLHVKQPSLTRARAGGSSGAAVAPRVSPQELEAPAAQAGPVLLCPRQDPAGRRGERPDTQRSLRPSRKAQTNNND